MHDKMKHLRYFAVGLSIFAVVGATLTAVAYFWPWPLIVPGIALVYICGRGLSGGFEQVKDPMENRND